MSITLMDRHLEWPGPCPPSGRTLSPGRTFEPGPTDMRRLIPSLAILVSAAACSNSSGPVPPRATLRVIVQDSTYKPLLSTQGSFYAKVGEQREVRLVYQGSLATDSGAEFLRFQVPADGLYRKRYCTTFGPSYSIPSAVTVVDPNMS